MTQHPRAREDIYCQYPRQISNEPWRLVLWTNDVLMTGASGDGNAESIYPPRSTTSVSANSSCFGFGSGEHPLDLYPQQVLRTHALSTRSRPPLTNFTTRTSDLQNIRTCGPSSSNHLY